MQAVKYSELKKIGTPQCRRWSSLIFKKHRWIDGYLKHAYIKKAREAGYVEANKMLFTLNKSLTLQDTSNSKQGREFYLSRSLSAAMDNVDLENLAVDRANKCKDIFQEHSKYSDIVGAVYRQQEYCDTQGIVFPLDVKKKDTYEAIVMKCMAAKERVEDSGWWRRQIRKKANRQVEAQLISLGFVTRDKESPYLSNYAFNRWKAQQNKNKNLISELDIVNEKGEKFALEEIVESSIANPSHRKDELIVRTKGYQEIAVGLGLQGVFFTLTCPSKYHAQREKGGRNPRYKDFTPADGMEHLNKMWSLIRSRWQKAGIKVFGFRVVEPHHDGTPHYHIGLFLHEDERERAKKIFGEVALLVDGDEKGAKEYRWDCLDMDPSKGGMVAYMLKYICKNINGDGVGVDTEGDCMAELGAARVRAWASLWGIRQFQQIGSVSVTVWREFRRRECKILEGCTEEIEKIRDAADKGDWKTFVELMGGPFVRRDEQTARPHYETDDKLNKYGEEIKKIMGVWLRPLARKLITRSHMWVVMRKEFQANAPPLLNINLPQHLISGCGFLESAKPANLDLCQ